MSTFTIATRGFLKRIGWSVPSESLQRNGSGASRGRVLADGDKWSKTGSTLAGQQEAGFGGFEDVFEEEPQDRLFSRITSVDFDQQKAAYRPLLPSTHCPPTAHSLPHSPTASSPDWSRTSTTSRVQLMLTQPSIRCCMPWIITSRTTTTRPPAAPGGPSSRRAAQRADTTSIGCTSHTTLRPSQTHLRQSKSGKRRIARSIVHQFYDSPVSLLSNVPATKSGLSSNRRSLQYAAETSKRRNTSSTWQGSAGSKRCVLGVVTKSILPTLRPTITH